MDRRMFLRCLGLAAGAAGTGGLLSACGGDEGGIPASEQTLSVIVASYETLVGEQRRIPFGLRTIDNEEIADAEVDVYLRQMDGTVVGGPFPTTFTRDAAAGIGLYSTTLDLPEADTYELVAVTGDEFGAAALRVVTPEQSELAVPGDAAIVTPTPTAEQPLGYAQICTQEPPCGMHEVSLDTALQEGKRVVLLFATPAYCQTAVCGPAVRTVDDVREAGDWGDAVWIHCEIFSDEGQTLGEPVQAWDLPTEPWLFTIATDGTIADRLDGPMLPDVVEGMATQLSA
jgi:hypothetical protein